MSDHSGFYHRREFLNREGYGSSAHVHAEISNDYFPYGEFSIMDCTRKATLEFSIYSAEERENTIFKLNKFLEVLNEFKDHLILKAIPAAVKREEENKKEAEKKKTARRTTPRRRTTT